MPRAEYFSVSHGSDPDDHLPVPRSKRYLWPGYSAGSTAAGTARGSMYAAQGVTGLGSGSESGLRLE